MASDLPHISKLSLSLDGSPAPSLPSVVAGASEDEMDADDGHDGEPEDWHGGSDEAVAGDNDESRRIYCWLCLGSGELTVSHPGGWRGSAYCRSCGSSRDDGGRCR